MGIGELPAVIDNEAANLIQGLVICKCSTGSRQDANKRRTKDQAT